MVLSTDGLESRVGIVHREWKNELRQFLLLIAIGFFLGYLAGYPGWGISLILLPYCYWLLRRTRALIYWLQENLDHPPPESTGVWGSIYDHLYRQQQQQAANVRRLMNIINRAQESTNAIRDAVVVLDRGNGLEWWNDAAEAMLGLRRESDRGQLVTNLLRDPRFVRYFEARHFDKDLEIPGTHHRQTMLRYQFTPFGEGELLMVVRDVSKMHNIEQMRKDFVANVSHELRTPLTVIRGYLETFIDSMEPGQSTLAKGLGQMDHQAKRMEMLVNDLLMLSRLETEDSREPVRTINLAELVQQVHTEALPLAESRQQSIRLDLDPTLAIAGAYMELRSAISNLVVNAVNYTPENGKIALRLWQDDDGAYLEVEDNGIGIDPKHIPRLTERFYRADPSRNTKTGGTGLGLAIVKHVLLHHNAYLNISSRPGEGSVFTCHFPAAIVVDSTTTPDSTIQVKDQSRKFSY